jgi:hypothetical protein
MSAVGSLATASFRSVLCPARPGQDALRLQLARLLVKYAETAAALCRRERH